MLNRHYTRPDNSGTDEGTLSASAGDFQEGAFMIAVVENGAEAIEPCAGNAGEVFAGVAMFWRQRASQGPVVEDLVVPDASGAYTVTLLATPIGGEAAMSFVDVSTGVPGSVISGADVTVTNNTVVFTAAESGKTIRITYTATYSESMARRMSGDGNYPQQSAKSLGRTGYIKRGTVSTSYYDTSKNWNNPAGASITLAAGGTVSLGGSGVELTNARISKAPTPTNPYLELKLV